MTKKIVSFISLVVSDLAVIFISFFLSHFIRGEILPHIIPKFQKVMTTPMAFFLNHFYVALLWVFVFGYTKLYTKRFTFWEEVKTLGKSATLSSILIMILIFITRKQYQYSRTIVILAWIISLVLFPVFRYVTKIILMKLHVWKKKLIILGANETSVQALKSIEQNKTLGYEILGILDDDPQKIGNKIMDVEILGPLSKLESFSKLYNSKDIMLAIPDLPKQQLHSLLARCENLSESLWLIPQSGDLITTGVEIENLGRVLTLKIKKNLAKPWNLFLKNVFEKFVTLILIIILLPLFLIIAAAIKLDSKGPVIFKQKRIGQRKHKFNLFKFRSMHTDADEKLSIYLSVHPEEKKEWEKYKKLRKFDPRVTRIGKIIRRFSLDELPQLFNVMLGKMSLVGPRPYLSEELKGKDTFTDTIAKVKPGLTGLWQISGRSELPFSERISLDEYYIRNWSLWLDIVILLKSSKVFFSSHGAY